MRQTTYDIFISYRRVGGKGYARMLKPELEKRGFKVFLDFDNLDDGVFNQHIKEAINESSIFMIILSEGALDRCVNKGDCVREEIKYAEKCHCHIVPVEFDKKFRKMPETTPDDISSIIGAHSWAQIDTETLLQESINKMVEKRIRPHVLQKDENNASANRSWHRYLWYIFPLLFLLFALKITNILHNLYGGGDKAIGVELTSSNNTNIGIELISVIDTFVKAYEQDEYHKIYWNVFSQIHLTPLNHSREEAPVESGHQYLMKFKGKLLYNGNPLTTYDSGETSDWVVTLYGYKNGPEMMSIVADEEGTFGGEELYEYFISVAEEAGFELYRKKEGLGCYRSTLYKRKDLFFLIESDGGSAGICVEITISPNLDDIKRFAFVWDYDKLSLLSR